jgi:hypothetical protein
MQKNALIVGMLSLAMIVAVGFAFAPVQKASTQDATVSVPETQWFHLDGIRLNSGEFLDLVDTTPTSVIHGHVALYIPCDKDGIAKIAFLQGTVDVDDGEQINTLAPAELELQPGLSSPAKNCLYHVDIGSDTETMTDFAIINLSGRTVTFTDRNTVAFTIAEVVAIDGGHEEEPPI